MGAHTGTHVCLHPSQKESLILYGNSYPFLNVCLKSSFLYHIFMKMVPFQRRDISASHKWMRIYERARAYTKSHIYYLLF